MANTGQWPGDNFKIASTSYCGSSKSLRMWDVRGNQGFR